MADSKSGPLVDLQGSKERDLFNTIGWVAAFGSVLLRCHPIFVMLRVLKTHNTAKMGTLWMQCVVLANSSVWLIYAGIILNSVQVRIACSSACLVNSVALFIRFRERYILADPEIIPDSEYRAALQDGSTLSNTILFCDRLVGVVWEGARTVFFTVPMESSSFVLAKLVVLDEKRKAGADLLWHVGATGGDGRIRPWAEKDGEMQRSGPTPAVLGTQHCGVGLGL